MQREKRWVGRDREGREAEMGRCRKKEGEVGNIVNQKQAAFFGLTVEHDILQQVISFNLQLFLCVLCLFVSVIKS